jgi:hypothetical protein
MTTQAPDRIWSGIDITKTLAGAIAAVIAAVAGSTLGVAGTLIGAAIASIVGSVGTEISARYLNRGAKKLQTLTPAFVKAPAAVGTPPVEAAGEEDLPSHTVPADQLNASHAGPSDKPKVQLRWGRIALIAGALFVLAMGSLTAVELFAGKSVASMVGHSTSGTTTFSSVTDSGGTQDETPTTTTSVAPSDEASTPTEEPTATPTGTPGTTEPTTQPTTQPTQAPTTGPTQAPQQTPPADTEPRQERDADPQE